MKHAKQRYIPIAIAMTWLLSQSLPAAAASVKERLSQGEIIVKSQSVPGSDTPKLTVTAVIESAPQAVWHIVDRCADYKKTMIRTVESEELSRKGTKVRCRVTVDLPFPLSDITAITEATHTVVPDKKYMRVWQLEKGDYHRNSGSWTLVPFDKTGLRTLVVYRVHAEPKIPIPSSIQKLGQKRSLPRLMENLREQLAKKK
jgi:ribosome-associated toxin RatA of RatAB toxin-antitoxin module